MSNKATIHITFPKSGIENLWVQNFIKNFKFSVQKVFSEQFEIRIKNIDFDSVGSISGVSQLDIFLIIMSAAQIETDEYQKELKELCRVLSLDTLHEIEASRIFKILLNPNESISQPDELKQISGYNFFEFIGRRKAFVTFDFEQNNSKMWSKILDVVYDINNIIKRLSNWSAAPDEKYVYLGNCSNDQANNRDDIRRELQHFGYRILPYVDLPRDLTGIQTIVADNLGRCEFAIQIVGEQYGSLTIEGKNSIYDIENQAIRIFLQSNPEKNQFIWVPSGMKNIESKQELYINRMKRDDSNFQTHIIEATLEEFKNNIAEYIESLKHFNTNNTAADLYIISKQNSEITFIGSQLSKLNLNVRKSFDTDIIISYPEHLQLLENTDNILLYYDTDDLTWLKSKTGDAVKAIGMGRKAPFKQFCIVSKTKIDISEISLWLNSVENILETDTGSLNEFFNKILESKRQ